MQKDNEVFSAPEQILICIGSREIPKRFWQSLKGLSQWDFAKVSWDLQENRVAFTRIDQRPGDKLKLEDQWYLKAFIRHECLLSIYYQPKLN